MKVKIFDCDTLPDLRLRSKSQWILCKCGTVNIRFPAKACNKCRIADALEDIAESLRGLRNEL